MFVSINSFDWVIFTGKEGEEDVFEICAIELKEINDKVKQLHVMIWFSSLFSSINYSTFMPKSNNVPKNKISLNQ